MENGPRPQQITEKYLNCVRTLSLEKEGKVKGQTISPMKHSFMKQKSSMISWAKQNNTRVSMNRVEKGWVGR